MFDLYIRSVAAHRQLNTASRYGQSSTRAANRVTHGSTIRPSRTAVCRTQNTGKLKPTSDRSRHTPQIRFSVAGEPHQLRSRNDLIKTQRTRSDAVENAAKSTKPTVILPLITVWLQVRVLSEPTTESIAGQSPVCGHGGLSPQVSGKCLHRQSGLRASHLTPKNSTINNRGRLLLFVRRWHPILRSADRGAHWADRSCGVYGLWPVSSAGRAPLPEQPDVNHDCRPDSRMRQLARAARLGGRRPDTVCKTFKSSLKVLNFT
jgi:hypothetical protein